MLTQKDLRPLIPLVAICLIAAILLAACNLVTRGPIKANADLAAQQTRTRLLADATSFEEMELKEGSGLDSCFEGLDANGDLVGYVAAITVNGYGGAVEVTVGLDAEGVIMGVNVGGEDFNETAGLGALAKEPEFTDQYAGKTVPLRIIKGNEAKGDDTIDTISGATITSTAVNGGVNLVGKYISDLSGGGSANTASVQGFGGPVAVTLTLDDAGAIETIVIGDDFFNETEGYGARALEESFQSQFIGLTPPLELSDIDALSGATVTSTAVVNAINTVYGQLTGAIEVSSSNVEEPLDEETPAAQEDETPAAQGDSYTASAQGYAGPVAVTLTLDGDTITAISIGDDSFAETDGLGAKALEAEFQEQFVGLALPVTADDITPISGATVTTTAVLSAIEEIYAQLPAEAAGDSYTASAQGYAGPVAVTLTLDGDTITAISIGDDSFAETDGLGAKALEAEFQEQFVGLALPVAADDITPISGATVTTTAILSAIEEIYAQLN